VDAGRVRWAVVPLPDETWVAFESEAQGRPLVAQLAAGAAASGG
jgi:hypothetical protein